MHTQLSIFISLALAACLCQAEIYKTTDENGNVVYTNVPTPTQQAEKVELPPVNQQPAVKTQIRPKQQKKAQTNISLSISSPANDSVIVGGNLTVVVQSSRGLPTGVRLDLNFNGSPKKSGQPGAFEFSNLDRGSYRLQAIAYDKNQKVVTKSPVVTVHIKRHSRI